MDDLKDSSVGRHWSWVPDALLEIALPNDPDLLTEIQCFSENDLTFYESIWEFDTISRLAVKVVHWLQVCPIPRHSL